MALRLVTDNTQTPAAQALPPVLDIALTGLSLRGRPILGRIGFQLHPGETVALTGPSGVGKTTLMRAIAGLEKGYSGRIACQGRLAMVFQEPTLLPWRSLRDNLVLPLGISAEAAETALAEVGLGGRGGDVPGQLSLGQQRRLSLARAFAGAPSLLLLDEPFVSLDAALADEMMSLFETLRARRTLATLIVTHDMTEARRLASRILRLSGSPAELQV